MGAQYSAQYSPNFAQAAGFSAATGAVLNSQVLVQQSRQGYAPAPTAGADPALLAQMTGKRVPPYLLAFAAMLAGREQTVLANLTVEQLSATAAKVAEVMLLQQGRLVMRDQPPPKPLPGYDLEEVLFWKPEPVANSTENINYDEGF